MDLANSSPTASLILGGIAIFYRTIESKLEFLVVKNIKTGNVSFVSGAHEEGDATEVDTIKREVLEELEINLPLSAFQPTSVKHEFIFGPKKKERAGLSGSYQVFLVDATDIESEIHNTEEVEVQWMTKNQAVDALSFPDLTEVFLKAIESI